MRTIITLLAAFALSHAGELHQAARECDANRMRQLLLPGPSLSETDESGMTPLHAAIDARQRACVSLLLEAGADRSERDRKGRTAFEAARGIADTRERADILLLFWHAGKEKTQESQGPMPWTIEHSVAKRQPDVTRMLLALGADPNKPGTAGNTPLADAAFQGDLNVVRALLNRGAKLNAVSRAGTQPIHDAALGGFAEVILELVTRGAEVDARTRDDGQTPLHAAAVMGKMKAVEMLVAIGADLTIRDFNGRTPLDAAERAGFTNVAAFLGRAATAE